MPGYGLGGVFLWGFAKVTGRGTRRYPEKGPRGRTDANHGGRPSGQECMHSTLLASKQASKQASKRERETDRQRDRDRRKTERGRDKERESESQIWAGRHFGLSSCGFLRGG